MTDKQPPDDWRERLEALGTPEQIRKRNEAIDAIARRNEHFKYFATVAKAIALWALPVWGLIIILRENFAAFFGGGK